MPQTCVLHDTLAMVYQKLYDLRRCILLVIVAALATVKVNAQCKANFSYSIDFNTGYVQFTNQSTLANSAQAVTYTWYSNPAIVLSNDTNPTIRLKPGIQPICLIVNNAGCIDTFCLSITMPPVHCRASYQYSMNFTMDTVSFVNNSSGLNLNYYWSFGDGSYSTEQNPQHRFVTNGWYYVCLNVVNTDTTCTDVLCDFVRINRPSPTPCNGDFSFEIDTVDSHKVFFTNMTVGDTGLTYYWLLGDSVTSNMENPTHRYDSVGNYTVCLLVSGTDCADSVCKVVEILTLIPSCKAKFSYMLFPDSGNNAARIALFNNQSSGTNLTYSWTFEDSLLSTEASPIHYFGKNGVYKVCLTVRSGGICTDSVCSFISIQTGISEKRNLSEISIYPIPAKDIVTIDFEYKIPNSLTIELYDVLGNRKLIKPKIEQNRIHLGISDLPDGLYLLELKTDKEIKTIRVLK